MPSSLCETVPPDVLGVIMGMLPVANRLALRSVCRFLREQAPAPPGTVFRIKVTEQRQQRNLSVSPNLAPPWALAGLACGRVRHLDLLVDGNAALLARWERLVGGMVQQLVDELACAGLGGAVRLVTVSPASQRTNCIRLLAAHKILSLRWPWAGVPVLVMSSRDCRSAFPIFDGDSRAALAALPHTRPIHVSEGDAFGIVCMFCPACALNGWPVAEVALGGNNGLLRAAEAVAGGDWAKHCSWCKAEFADAHVVSLASESLPGLRLLPFAGLHFMARQRNRNLVTMLCVTRSKPMGDTWPRAYVGASASAGQPLSDDLAARVYNALCATLSRGVPFQGPLSPDEPLPVLLWHGFRSAVRSRTRCPVDPVGAAVAELQLMPLWHEATVVYHARLRLTMDLDGLGVVVSLERRTNVAQTDTDTFLAWMAEENATPELRAIGAGWVATTQPVDGMLAVSFCASLLWPMQAQDGTVSGVMHTVSRLLGICPARLGRPPTARLGLVIAALLGACNRFSAAWKRPQFVTAGRAATAAEGTRHSRAAGGVG